MFASSATQLAIEFLREGARRLDADHQDGRSNLMIVRGYGEAAILLRADDITHKAEEILGRAPDEQFFAGLMSNFPLPKRASPAQRHLPSLEVATDRHPRWSIDESRREVEAFGRTEPHLALCAGGAWDEAWRVADDDPIKAFEVAVTQAAIGDLTDAMRRMQVLSLENWRQRHAQVVCAIELARRGQIAECRTLVDGLLAADRASDLLQWELLDLALGVAGYQPWGGYPYSDY